MNSEFIGFSEATCDGAVPTPCMSIAELEQQTTNLLVEVRCYLLDIHRNITAEEHEVSKAPVKKCECLMDSAVCNRDLASQCASLARDIKSILFSVNELQRKE